MLGWVVSAVVACAAAVACLRAARLGSVRGALGWRLQATANLFWAGYALLRAADVPDLPATASWVGWAVAVGGGVWLVSRAVDPRSRTRMLLDGVTAATSTLVLLWTAGFGPAWESSGRGPVDAGLLGRPVAAMGLAAFYALVMLAEIRPGRRLMPALATGSLLVTAAAEAARSWGELGGRVPSGLVAAGFVLAPALTMASASVYRGTTRRIARPPTSRHAVALAPYVLLVPAGLVLLEQRLLGEQIDAVQGWAVVVLVLVVLLRQGLTAAENRDLVHRLSTSEKRLRHQATHDPLTGLANRSLLTERLLQAAAGRRPTGLLVLDLDGFKAVNDQRGHTVGDRLLQQTADRIRAEVRSGDLAVRLGGDEFAVVVHDGLAPVVAERLQRALSQPFDIDGQQVTGVSASIGVAFCRPTGPDRPPGLPPPAGPTGVVEGLLHRADAAMYAAKRTGAGGVVVEPRDPEGDDGAPLPA